GWVSNRFGSVLEGSCSPSNLCARSPSWSRAQKLIFRAMLQPVPPSPRASSETRAASASVGVAAIEIEAFAPSSHLVAESTLAHSRRGFDYVREQIEYDLFGHRSARWLIEIRDRDGSLRVTVLRAGVIVDARPEAGAHRHFGDSLPRPNRYVRRAVRADHRQRTDESSASSSVFR